MDQSTDSRPAMQAQPALGSELPNSEVVAESLSGQLAGVVEKELQRVDETAPAVPAPRTKEDAEEGKAPKYVSTTEQAAVVATQKMSTYIEERNGQYVKDEDSSLHVIIEGRRIELNHDIKNYNLASLFIDGCQNSTFSPIAKSTIQRLQVIAAKESSRVRLRQFSAFSDATNQLYIPISGGSLLNVTADEILMIENGQNECSFWIEHPESDPFEYSRCVDPVASSREFERLLVDTQACAIDEMRWLVAMDEGFFPYIRDAFPARLLLVHIGASQNGKTTGACRFILLHGLGQVTGDCTVAALADMGDRGLLVLDNKEQANFNQDLIDYCLYLATGAMRARSSREGRVRKSSRRPVAVITTIEGTYKKELQNRCISIEYKLRSGDLSRADVEREIRQRRGELCSFSVEVLRWYMKVRLERRQTPNPVPSFREHFTALSDLLRAFGEAAKKPAAWSEQIIQSWNRNLQQREEEEDELENPILRLIREGDPCFASTTGVPGCSIESNGRQGALYVTECGPLLTALQKLNLRGFGLPKTASGLGKRLRGTSYSAFKVLDEETCPDLSSLKRRDNKRPIGFFVPNDMMTDSNGGSTTPVTCQTPENERKTVSSDTMT